MSKPVLIGLIVASAVALLAIITVIVLLIARRRRRRRTQEFAQRLASPTFPIQQPDFGGNGGGAVIFADKTVYTPAPVPAPTRELTRNNSQMTARTRWSQESFATFQARQRSQSTSGEFTLESAPPVPPLRFASRQDSASAVTPASIPSSRQGDLSVARGESADGRSGGDGDWDPTSSAVSIRSTGVA